MEHRRKQVPLVRQENVVLGQIAFSVVPRSGFKVVVAPPRG
jgi:hypothetical protein